MYDECRNNIQYAIIACCYKMNNMLAVQSFLDELFFVEQTLR